MGRLEKMADATSVTLVISRGLLLIPINHVLAKFECIGDANQQAMGRWSWDFEINVVVILVGSNLSCMSLVK